MIKLTLHFKSGNQISLKCESFVFNYSSTTLEFSGYTFEKPDKKVSFVPSELEAYEHEYK